MALVPWIDNKLFWQEYGMQLVMAQLPSKKRLLVLVKGEKHKKAAQELGFNLTSTGLWVKNSQTFTIGEFQRFFPKLTIARIDHTDVIKALGGKKPEKKAGDNKTPGSRKSVEQQRRMRKRDKVDGDAPMPSGSEVEDSVAEEQQEPVDTKKEQVAEGPRTEHEEQGDQESEVPDKPIPSNEPRRDFEQDLQDGIEQARAGRVAQESGNEEYLAEGDAELDTELGRIERLLARADYLGTNRTGHEVYRDADGRFYRHGPDRVIREEELANAPALFLRATGSRSFADCADAFVEEIVAGRIQRKAEFHRFVRAIFDNPDMEVGDRRMRQTRRAIDDAVVRAIVRNASGVYRDSYHFAQRLFEGFQAPQDTIGEEEQALGDKILPFPLMVAMQRVIGHQGELAGKKVSVLNAVNGMLGAVLPRSAKVHAVALTKNHGTRTKANLSSAGIEDFSVTTNMDVGLREDSTFQIGELPSREIPPVQVRGLAATNAAHAAMMTALVSREANGRSVFLLDKSQQGMDDAVLDWVHRHFHIEGVADLDQTLHQDNHNKRMFVVGPRRAEFENANNIPTAELPLFEGVKAITNHADLWTWTTEIVAARGALAAEIEEEQAARFMAGLAGEEEGAEAVDLGSRSGHKEENAFQAPYTPTSRMGEPSAMCPRNMERGLRIAMANIVARHGDVDEFVARELGWTLEELGQRLSPEQIDGVAMGIDAETRNRGYVVSDQTGLGKGRIQAALVLRAIRRGQKVMFLTEGNNLFFGHLARYQRHRRAGSDQAADHQQHDQDPGCRDQRTAVFLAEEKRDGKDPGKRNDP